MRLFDTFGKPVMAVAAALALVGNGWAQCPAADSYEPNDDCVTAPPLANGTYTGLTVEGTGGTYNDDFFAVSVPPGEILTVDCLFIDAIADVDLYLYDPATSPNCGGEAAGDYLVRGFSVTDNEQVVWPNTGAVALPLIVRVEMFSAATCNDYDLVISTAPDPCASPVDDAFEENDTCGAGVALGAGTTTGLFVSDVDPDFYLITVPANDMLTVDVSYGGGTGDVDLRLYSDLACTTQIDSVFPTAGTGQVSYANATGAAATWVLTAEVVAGQGCNNYDLTVTTAPDPCLAIGDDSFEDNDDCASASLVPTGLTSGLRMFGQATADDNDYYLIQGVPTGQILTCDVLFIDANGDIDVTLFSDPACTVQVDGSFSTSDNEQVSVANGTGANADYYLRVYAFGTTFTCNDYDLQITVAPDPCATAADDGFEDNDDCVSAVALASGVQTGLFVSETDHDYYAVTVPANEILTVDVSYVSGANGDVDLYLFDDPACANQVDVDFGFGGTGQVSWSNGTGAAATAYLSARVAVGEGCNNYDLNVATAPDPCLNPLSDDSFEDNDDCSNAVSMNDGLFPGLFVSKADEDFYEVSVADTDVLTVNLFFSTATADIDIYLYDDLVGCGDLASYLVRGFTGSDDETITWTNSTGSVQTYYVQVVVWANSGGECNNYDMEILGSGGVLATPFCFGDGTADVGGGVVGCPCANESALGAGEGCKSSLGFGAILTASGTSIVANDDLVFTVSQARANQPSMLVQGSTLVSFPFKDGILCMGNPTERVEVVFTDGTGSGSTVSSIVTNGNITPGVTRYYQQWYRDPGGVSPCGTGSNFTQGLTINWI
ncbi:MAG: PPC domain-containing protein [Planctomycetes bacterium]|nr:PPC domain-containing protein [Planctomycetota bacterium]MCB9905421.1 PPC domain-containing protein [Planctomycetota bacterium]